MEMFNMETRMETIHFLHNLVSPRNNCLQVLYLEILNFVDVDFDFDRKLFSLEQQQLFESLILWARLKSKLNQLLSDAIYIFQKTIHRSSNNIPPRVLRPPDHQEVVGAVPQAALARQHRHVPLRPGQGQDRVPREEGCHGDIEGDGHEILSLVIHSLYQRFLLHSQSVTITTQEIKSSSKSI